MGPNPSGTPSGDPSGSSTPKPTATPSGSRSTRTLDPELAPFQHHIDSKAFYQLHLPRSLFPNQEEKRKSRGKKRKSGNSKPNQIRMMLIDRRSRILFATASAVYRVSNVSAVALRAQWEQVISLCDIFGVSNSGDMAEEIITMELCRDLFSDHGHYQTVPALSSAEDMNATDLLEKSLAKLDPNRKFVGVPEDESSSFLTNFEPIENRFNQIGMLQ